MRSARGGFSDSLLQTGLRKAQPGLLMNTAAQPQAIMQASGLQAWCDSQV